VRDTLVHIISGEWIWLEYWKEPFPISTFVTELRARRDLLFNPDVLPNLASVQLKWVEIEREQIDFVNGVTNELLERMVFFRARHVSLKHLMQHVANHSTYHRGQVALMMRQLGKEPMATDFQVFLVERPHEHATEC
jgi:uncharacterized damage-inducible protein DinB